jgi:transposase-like protein
MKKTPGPSTSPADIPERRPLQELAVVRARAEDLESVLSNMWRTSEDTKVRIREYFVEGLSIAEIAERHGCSLGLVANAVRRVREQLASSMAPWQFVTASVTLPLGLARDMLALSDALMRATDRAQADDVLLGLSRAVATAQKKLEKP